MEIASIISPDEQEFLELDNLSARVLHDYFEQQVRIKPHHPAVECNDETVTYLELDERARWIATALRSRGLAPGSLVGLYAEKSCDLYAALIGALKAGLAYVPIDLKLPLGRIQSILEDADIRTVLSAGELGKALASKIAGEVIFFESVTSDGPPIIPFESVPVNPTDLCYVIYTSGSTGRPKGVMIEHRSAVNFVRSLREVYKLGSSDRIYQGFSLAFDASVEEIWAALALGGTLVVPPEAVSRSAIDAAEFLCAHRITYFSTVPSFLAMITEELPTVRLLVVGGEACPSELVRRWTTPARRMLNTYGPTEATIVATAAECIAGEPVTIGGALPGYETYVLDDKLRPVEPGSCGELFIAGRGLARGYLNRPELTTSRFLPNPFRPKGSAYDRLYRTYDLVRLTETGMLQFVGRADEQIKIRGFRVELTEIEAILVEHPGIRAAAVKVVELGAIKELAAYVVQQPGAEELDYDAVRVLLCSRLPDYMIPRYLDVIDALPALTSGKTDRKRLPAPGRTLSRSRQNVVPPRDELERTIVSVWETHFHLSPICIDDDFFRDLHGHSMTAAHVISELRSRCDSMHVSVRDLYEHQTPRELADHLRAATMEKKPSAEDADPDATAAQEALPWTRWPCAMLQLMGIIAYYAVVAAPAVFLIVLVLQVTHGELEIVRAADIATTASFFIWPSWLLLSITVKWLVIGRYKSGRYPLWGWYYLRWWLVSRFQALSWSEMFVGTPLMSIYYRAMGAKVGRNCTLSTALCTAFDLVTIGENTAIGAETQMLGYRIEGGHLVLGTVSVGNDCYIGTHCCLGLETVMEDHAALDDMSHLPDHEVIASGQGMRGSPARPARIDMADFGEPPKARFGHSFMRGLRHLVLIYAMGYFLLLSLVPAVALVGYGLYTGGTTWGIAMALAAVPVSIIWYLVLVVGLKRLVIGRIRPGCYSLDSKEYVRYWFMNFLWNNTRQIVMPLFATLAMPTFLRCLGAKIGHRVEVSTIMHVVPDLLTLEAGSFLADACIVGGHRIYHDKIELRPNRIGTRSFIGNSAFLPSGVDMGNDALIGVTSVPPVEVKRVVDGTRWLGSPAFELPSTQGVSSCFTDAETFAPTTSKVVLRLCAEMMRILLPGLIACGNLIVFCTAIVVAWRNLPIWSIAIIAPSTAVALSIADVAIVAYLKRMLIGAFRPTVKPLWSPYVWLNEVVNGLYESISARALMPLLGTPFISPCLRLMGCKIGRWVFLQTTLFSEFDLVEIGDRAALNLGSTIQTHLFEDRVMKTGRLVIGPHCSVGNMAVVLYDTRMEQGSSLGPLSVLMKGEVLPSSSRWVGIPTQRISITASQATRQRDAVTALVQRHDRARPVTERRVRRQRSRWHMFRSSSAAVLDGHEAA